MSLKSKFEDIPSDVLQRRLDRERLWSSTTLQSLPDENYDPILTPIFTSFATGTFSAVSGGAFFAQAAAAIATTSVSVGVDATVTQ